MVINCPSHLYNRITAEFQLISTWQKSRRLSRGIPILPSNQTFTKINVVLSSFLEERLGRTKNRRIFVYNFCLINICLSLSNDANKIKTLNIERA